MTPDGDVDEFEDYEVCAGCGSAWPPEELDVDDYCPDCAEDEA